jgi:two-component system CheB/CheR fusion protein
LWGLRSDEIQGQHFLNLDIGLPVEQLKQPIRNCLAGENDLQEIILNANNRRGKAIECKVSCKPLLGKEGEVRGVLLFMEEQEGVPQ